jgi:GNAT superfamily N-acetyltransferase
MLRRRLCDSNTYVVAAELEDQIAGVSMWIPPKANRSLQRRIPWYFRLLSYVYKAYDAVVSLLHFFPRIERYLYPAWPGVKQRLQALQAVDRQIQQKVIPFDIREQGYWTLALLGTDERFQRRGVGGRLLRWGCDKADETDSAVFMTASVKGEQLYLKHGFEVLSKELLFEEETKDGIWQAYMMRFPKSRRDVPEDEKSLLDTDVR